MKQNIVDKINEHAQIVKSMLENNLDEIEALCCVVVNRIHNGGKILFAGNGGSAADCQHLAAEFIGRFKKSRGPIPAIALTTDTSILTAVGNDFGYENVFLRQVSALCAGTDILIVISTSGNSINLVHAVKAAKAKLAYTIGFLGNDGGKLLAEVDLPIVIKSKEAARIQECHILIGHILCDACDENSYTIH